MSGKRVWLLPQGKNVYKANLHCHSTVSDGQYTPEEIKRLYKEKGYQVVAMTDHEIMVPHEELSDESFLMLTAYELAVYGDRHLPKPMRRLSHLNIYAKKPGTTKMPFFNTADVLQLDKPPDVSRAKFDGPEIEKEYSVEGLNKLIRMAREAGFIVCYNHPTWSMEDASIYTNLEGLFAMEIFNYGCENGYASYCPYIYDEMLRSGQRIAPIASDDTHKERNLFGGFTMIYADELKYEKITDAMERGDFYASRGPEIRALWFENGMFHIETSPVRRIFLSNSGRRQKAYNYLAVARPGELITSAEFPLSDMDLYVRFTAEDERGMTANTRGYLREEFTDEPASVPDLLHRKIVAVSENLYEGVTNAGQRRI